MICKVEKTIEKYNLLDNIRTVAVGVSGGADSMCLLSVLNSFKDKYGIIIKAVHINHNLRGDEALRDESFVRDYCDKNDIELIVYSEDIKALSEKMGVGTEECGRIVRYNRFSEMNCDAVAVAHSLSDSIETVLFNMARGTTLKGICGIPAKRKPNIIRPLIECTRKEIEYYCEYNNVPYITDSSNLSDCYMRNHIRHNLVPAVAKINENYENNFLRCFTCASEDEDFLSEESKKLLTRAITDKGYNVSVLRNSHSALRKRALLFILKTAMNKSVENKHVELFNELVLNGYGKMEVADDFYLVIKNDIIFTENKERPTQFWKADFICGKAETPVGVYCLTDSDEICNNAIDADKISGELYLSSRLEQDRFTFKNRGVSKSLKKLFNEMKIPKEKRNLIPVLHDGTKVVWVENVGINSAYIPDNNTKKIIIIKKEG